ncbi:MAG: citrate/2-methylcitrate synthase [Gemmatimonadota bacterium]
MSGSGLEGGVVARTRLSHIDGAAGRLAYGGYSIEDLAAHATFEEVAHLLWHGELPGRTALDALRARLGEALTLDASVLDVIRSAPSGAHPMAVLRTAVSALGMLDPEAEDTSEAGNIRKAVRLTAQLPVITAAIGRIRAGREPVEAHPEEGIAANFLRMLTGTDADPDRARVIDVALILHAEHGMNASTFSGRVTIATLSDLYSAVTSAIGTLKGSLHGGANERVMRMLEAIGEPERVDAWIRAALDRNEKIMGFGHRVYRALDPRAPILRDLARGLAGGDASKWLRISDRIVDVMDAEMQKRGKQIYPNVDFFSASVYRTLGIPTDLFTNVFACARVVGWTAHAMEQLADNRLIRPRAEYVGPAERTVEPIDERP